MFSDEDTEMLWDQACYLGRELRKGDAAQDWWPGATVKQNEDAPTIYFKEYGAVGFKRRFILKWSPGGDFLDFHGEAGQKVFSLIVEDIFSMASAFARRMRIRTAQEEVAA